MRLEVVIHFLQWVPTFIADRLKVDIPFETVEDGGEGISEDEVVVDELAIGAAGSVGNAPAEGFGGAGEYLANAFAVLEADFIGMNMVAESPGLNDGEEAPAKLGFTLLGEFDRDDACREGTIHQRPKALTHAGGVHDDVLGIPGLGEVFEFSEDRKVVLTDPTMTGDNMVGGAL
jgi:hypothetical protein